MDNLTHSLIGIVAAEAITKTQTKKKLHFPLTVVSIFANNFPDLDFIYTPLMGGRAASLGHHRGHTHTLLLSPIMAVLSVFALFLFLRLRGKTEKFSKKEKLVLFLTALLGIFLHIFADSWNSYGVHPFWPFQNRWLYGDFIFIIEPFLWMAMLPFAYWSLESRLAKNVILTFFALTSGIILFSGFVPISISIFCFLFGATFFVVYSKIKPCERLVMTTVSILFVLTFFYSSSLKTKKIIKDAVKKSFPLTKLHDVILSPYPGNPFCWRFGTVESIDDLYVVRTGIASPYVKLFPAGHCPEISFFQGKDQVPMVPVPAFQDPKILWEKQFEGSISDLKKLKTNYCGVNAFLRFSRMPGWAYDDKNELYFLDLRFRGPFVVTDLKNCDIVIPPWQSPRADLGI
ncbi:MAG: metal-dependent hydrolase [Bacteriovoracia bacterium]